MSDFIYREVIGAQMNRSEYAQFWGKCPYTHFGKSVDKCPQLITVLAWNSPQYLNSMVTS